MVLSYLDSHLAEVLADVAPGQAGMPGQLFIGFGDGEVHGAVNIDPFLTIAALRERTTEPLRRMMCLMDSPCEFLVVFCKKNLKRHE